ncbi:S8 family peptidase [Actinokineospora guangxiensis]|uniref:S8 family peptidase n=1 Tax=Actinokineospora guangxiensis TaxID=1490288 RepID=A0ABW0EUX5_9PSEU
MTRFRAARTRMVAVLAVSAAASAVLTGQATAAAEGTVVSAANAIPGSYIVTFKDGALGTQSARSLTGALADRHGVSVEHTYEHAVHGFSGTMSAKAARRLAADPSVAMVEQNGRVSLAATQSPTPSWGLDRTDQRNRPLNNSYSYTTTGSGVTAYVLDTGIRTTHRDFGGRAVWGTNTVGDGNNTDCNGHGTHVAGTVGGTSYGIAKSVRLVAVKVLSCSGSGSWAGVIAGIDWVTNHHTSGPAVANMSLGGSGTNASLENAVRRSIADGVTYALASGNSNSNACNFTPARTPEAITVNASTNTDARASFSNYGTCTDIFAPGQNITSAWHTSDTATNTISGTSMASPHVAGAAARVLSGNPGLTPAQVASTLVSASTPNVITSPGSGSPNRLLYLAPTA